MTNNLGANVRYRSHWLYLFVVLLSNATVFVLLLSRRQSGVLNNRVAILSGWFSIALFSAIWIGVLGRRVSRHRGRLSGRIIYIGTAAIGVITGLSLTAIVRSMPSADITFALSGRPLNEIDSPQRRLLIELLRKNEANSKEYAASAAYIKPIEPPLYSAQSFQDGQTMQRTMDCINTAYRVDLDYAARQEGDLADFQAKMGIADPTWLKSWKLSDAGRQAAQDQLLATERQWMLSVNALYAYGIERQAGIHVVQGTLQFSSPAVEVAFGNAMGTSKHLYEQMVQKRQQLVERQRASRLSQGLE